MYLRNLNKNKAPSQAIKQINQSKEFDAIQKQLQKNQQYLRMEFPNRKAQDDTKFYSIQQPQKTQRINQDQNKKYATNELTQAKTMSKIWNYNSAVDNSTQAASPQYKFTTQLKAQQDTKTETQENSVKKKLFYEEEYEQTSQNSPQFNLKQSKYDSLVYTFKKKVDQYPRLFSERSKQGSPATEGKLNFTRVNFSIDTNAEKFKQNDPFQLNFNIDPQPTSSIKKKLNFESVSLKEENPILKQIKQELKRDNQALEQQESDYKVSRRNQSDLIKRKILESRSDLKRFYEADSQNVQYEYRKAKFMDIFLGGRVLQHNLR